MNELVETFETLKARICEHGEYIARWEYRTRQLLVDPLLIALGWDVTNPLTVKLEHDIDDIKSRADYALFRAGRLVAIVEAKRLDGDLDEARAQVFKYARSVGCRWASATDGNKWLTFDMHAQGTSARKIGQPHAVLSIDSDSAKTCASIAREFSHPNSWSMEGAPPTEPTVVPNIYSSRPTVRDWFPLGSPMPRPLIPPTSVRIADGIPQPVGSWRELYLAVARHLVATGALERRNVPICARRGNRYLVNSSPVRANGRDFKNPEQIVDGLWLDTNGGASGLARKSAKLIEACGGEPGMVEVRLG